MAEWFGNIYIHIGFNHTHYLWFHSIRMFLYSQIIGGYLKLISERARDPLKVSLPSVHALNSHFLAALQCKGYDYIKTWLKVSNSLWGPGNVRMNGYYWIEAFSNVRIWFIIEWFNFHISCRSISSHTTYFSSLFLWEVHTGALPV